MTGRSLALAPPRSGRRRLASTLLVAALVAASISLGGCGDATDASRAPEPSTGPSAPAPSEIPSPAGTSAPAESPSPSPSATATPTVSPATAIEPDRFWEAVRAGARSAGHLIVTATGASPVVIRYRTDAAIALVEGDVVSLCAGGVSYAGAAGSLGAVPGAWRCGFDALIAGFRMTGSPIDAWSPDFPSEGSEEERVAALDDGRWRWTLSTVGLEGDGTATLLFDPASGRLIEGTRKDELGATSWAFDYATRVEPIVAP